LSDQPLNRQVREQVDGLQREVLVRERVLAIVNLIAKYVLAADDAPISEQELVAELLSVGFETEEINDAFSWMEMIALQPKAGDTPATARLVAPTYRVFSRAERQALEPEALGFLVRLRTLGLLSDEAQEEVIERAVQAAEDPVNLQEIKLISALTLLSRSSNLWQREIDCFFDSDWSRIYH
jgi:Smg protein